MAAGANCSTNPMTHTHTMSMLSSSYFQNELLKHLLLAYINTGKQCFEAYFAVFPT